MAREGKTRRSVVQSDTRPIEEPQESCDDKKEDSLHTEGIDDGHEALVSETEESLDVPSEVAQEIWESLKEEFYEQIEQLPLSLHRSFSLIGEQDREVQACQAELLPTIRSYVKLRLQIQASAQSNMAKFSDEANSPYQLLPCPKDSLANDTSGDRQSVNMTQGGVNNSTHKEGMDIGLMDYEVASRDAPLGDEVMGPRSSSPHSLVKSRSHSSPAGESSPLVATRAHALRETDATVPKSVPFPPRPKPKTTRELLARASLLMGELLRASGEKVGLASAAYDSVDRHVRALDATIKEHENAAQPGLREGTRLVGNAVRRRIETTINEGECEDDEEPQLGMVGPTADTEGKPPARLRRNTKRNRRDPRRHIMDGQPPTRVHASYTTAHQEMPGLQEPRYCYCNQVSYGEMIACDNPDCSREWFHLGCVGLASPPKGKVKWYCRVCEEALGRNRRRRVR